MGPARYVSRGTTVSKRIALSFHTEGTTAQVTRLLDMAKTLEVPLTMLIIGEWLDKNRDLGRRIPTYITLKDVKKRWGHGQEDVFPISQFEKLWGDMTALSDVKCSFLVVPTLRGQQLKDPAQLDGWLRDGSAAYVESLCEW